MRVPLPCVEGKDLYPDNLRRRGLQVQVVGVRSDRVRQCAARSEVACYAP